MLIRCFGVDTSFDYDQIGGTDSFFRRLGAELCQRGHEIHFIHYGCREESQSQPVPNLHVKRFRTLGDALEELAADNAPVLVNAVKAMDRPRFIRFRYQMRHQIDFHIVYSLFAHTRFGRLKHFLEAMLYRYRPGAICMSQRLVDYVRTVGNQAELLLPPVPVDYFAQPEEKGDCRKLVVAYFGRLEEGKGAPEAIELLETLAQRDDIEARVYGYSYRGTPEAQPLARRVQHNNRITYRQRTHQGWTPEVERDLTSELREIDILLLPYRRVASSIDTPLLLLEGMAALCCCVVPPQGDIPEIYGDSPFLIPNKSFVQRTSDLMSNGVRGLITQERKRLHSRIRQLQVDTPSAADRLLEILRKG
ncbi:MAG: glycosyltransferase family 4 protein [Planctomycetes bacterium]|nr:glycosyltransferase family 4 protein [Planctomycetota bacterium]